MIILDVVSVFCFMVLKLWLFQCFCTDAVHRNA